MIFNHPKIGDRKVIHSLCIFPRRYRDKTYWLEPITIYIIFENKSLFEFGQANWYIDKLVEGWE